MQVEYINPFVTSVKNTFGTMLGCQVRRGPLVLKQDHSPQHEVSGVIGLSGRAAGTVVLSFSAPLAIKAASILLMTELPQINDEVLDAVGELTNMVAGGAKAELEEYRLAVSLPNVITGKGHVVHFPSEVTPIGIPFETEWGPLTLEVGFAPVREPVAT